MQIHRDTLKPGTECNTWESGSMHSCNYLSFSERPFLFLELLEPRRSGTLFFPKEDDAMEENSPALPGLPPQPAPGTLEKQ